MISLLIYWFVIRFGAFLDLIRLFDANDFHIGGGFCYDDGDIPNDDVPL